MYKDIFTHCYARLLGHINVRVDRGIGEVLDAYKKGLDRGQCLVKLIVKQPRQCAKTNCLIPLPCVGFKLIGLEFPHQFSDY